MRDNLVAKLYASPKTIFTTRELALVWGEVHSVNLLTKIKYYVKQGLLIRLSRGIYTKSREYPVKELATSMYAPSYVSFETVLREAGIIFQHQEAIFVAGPYAITKKIDGHTFIVRKLKENVLFNGTAIRHEKTYSIATPERALLDTLYLTPKCYFDNLRPIDWDICSELVSLYNNKQLIKRLDAIRNYA